MKKLRDWLASIPHLFGKAMVIWCVACGSASGFYALRVLSRTDKDPTALLGTLGAKSQGKGATAQLQRPST